MMRCCTSAGLQLGVPHHQGPEPQAGVAADGGGQGRRDCRGGDNSRVATAAMPGDQRRGAPHRAANKARLAPPTQPSALYTCIASSEHRSTSASNQRQGIVVQGYLPQDYENLDTAYGSEADLRRLCRGAAATRPQGAGGHRTQPPLRAGEGGLCFSSPRPDARLETEPLIHSYRP